MKPMTHSEFWRMDRGDRNDRICDAEDEGVCSICAKPLVVGEQRDGLIEAHWDCSHPPDEITAEQALADLKRIIDDPKNWKRNR